MLYIYGMKLLFSIVFSLFFLVSTTGIIATIHTCHNTITGIYLLSSQQDCCCMQEKPSCCDTSCGIELTQTECCENSPVFIKYTEDLFVPVKTEFSSHITIVPCATSAHDVFVYETTTNLPFSTLAKPPPLEDLYSLFCSYIFYG